ncbi:hypothetical protein ACQR5T_04035 [Xanthomonas oryzae pv. oryzicola]|uniref:hypothetical protein n=2 Tax=Xanthomonas oryzae TaxID=347 RepID=UPI0012AEF4C2|nr:hypothetical protein [Xanthomonas oryzae]
MNGMNGLLRMIAVPACAGISSACFFLIPLIGSDYPYDGGRLGALVFFAIFGGIMGFIVGCPIILFVDWKWRAASTLIRNTNGCEVVQAT